MADTQKQIDSPWLTPEQAAAYLGLNEQVIRRKAANGEITSTRLNDDPKGPLRFHREWLDDFAMKRVKEGEQ